MPDGSVFVFENKKTETKTDSSLSDTERGISIRSVSTNSIYQTEENINREYSDIDTKFSIREDARYKNDRVDDNQFRDFEISDWEFDAGGYDSNVLAFDSNSLHRTNEKRKPHMELPFIKMVETISACAVGEGLPRLRSGQLLA